MYLWGRIGRMWSVTTDGYQQWQKRWRRECVEKINKKCKLGDLESVGHADWVKNVILWRVRESQVGRKKNTPSMMRVFYGRIDFVWYLKAIKVDWSTWMLELNSQFNLRGLLIQNLVGLTELASFSNLVLTVRNAQTSWEMLGTWWGLESCLVETKWIFIYMDLKQPHFHFLFSTKDTRMP